MAFSFTCDHRSLARVVRTAAQLIGGRKAQRNAGACLEVGDGSLTLTVTNQDVTVAQRVAVDSSGTAALVVPFAAFRGVVLSRRSGRLEAHGGDEAMTIRSGAFEAELSAVLPGWFPTPEGPVEPTHEVTVGSYAFRDGLRHTALSVSYRYGWRPQIAGLEISDDEGRLRFAATDMVTLAIADFRGRRLSRRLPSPIIVAPEALDALGRHLPDRREVTVKIGRHQIEFVAGDTAIRVETVLGAFPDYEPFRRSTSSRSVLVQRKPLLRAVERVAVFSGRDRPPGLWVEFADDSILVRTLDRQVGSGAVRVPARVVGAPCTVGLPLGTVIACLRALDGTGVAIDVGDPAIRVSWYSPDHPERRYHMLPINLAPP
jgi:DNA polymerase III sliding clamp (beta) subunit (PCNA family)